MPSLRVIKNWALSWRVPTLLLCIIVTVLLRVVPPRFNPSCRVVDLWDSAINHPHVEKETFHANTLIPIVILPVFCVYLPVVYLFSATTRPAHREFWTWLLAHWTSWCLSDTVVDIFKIYAGRFRPDFIDRLRIAGLVEGNHPPTWVNDTVVDLCQEKYITNALLREGRLSFPSGHSAMSFGSMVVLFLFLFSKLRPFHFSSYPRIFIAMLPLALAFVVAISRTIDYWHNFSDILAGSILGTVGAIIAVFLNFDYVKAHGTFVPKRPVTKCCSFGSNLAVAEDGCSVLSGVDGANQNMSDLNRDYATDGLMGNGGDDGPTGTSYISARTQAAAFPGLLTGCCVPEY